MNMHMYICVCVRVCKEKKYIFLLEGYLNLELLHYLNLGIFLFQILSW